MRDARRFGDGFHSLRASPLCHCCWQSVPRMGHRINAAASGAARRGAHFRLAAGGAAHSGDGAASRQRRLVYRPASAPSRAGRRRGGRRLTDRRYFYLPALIFHHARAGDGTRLAGGAAGSDVDRPAFHGFWACGPARALSPFPPVMRTRHATRDESATCGEVMEVDVERAA